LALGLKSDDLDALLSLNRIDDLELINKNLSNIMPAIAPENQDLLIPALSQLYGYLEEPTIGASGALFGIIGAFAMLFPNTEIFLLFPPIPIKAKWLAIGYGAYEIYQAMQNSASDPIAHLAHLGGMAVGLALVYFVYNKQNRHFY
jgi:membrane associated rhomboid family serine protease